VKHRQVEQTLRRLGRSAAPSMRPISPAPQPYGYRNRITVHAEDGVIGYYRRDVHRLIDVERCPIAAPEVNAALLELRARRPRDGHYTLRAHEGPRVFEQTNDEVADALARVVESLLPDDRKLLIDAYCGAGFFAKRLREKFEQVVGIEWDRHAIAAARVAAAAHETYLAADVELELAQQLAQCEPRATTVLVVPPGTGLPSEVRRMLIERPAHTLIYVSCNPATLARDLAELQSQFTIVSVTPLDMFPQSAEVDVVAHLQHPGAPGSGSTDTPVE
jgi:23S rRNA (uracil1939-C5)-methyltransferase